MNFRTFIWLLILLPLASGVTRKQLVDYAVKQYKRTIETAKPGLDYVVQGEPTSDKWLTTQNATGHYLFQAGMYAGILWHLYRYTNDKSWKELAIKATDGEYEAQFVTFSHDIGFAIDNAYGLGFDLTGNKSYATIITSAARHLATRYNDKVGCIRSWDSPKNKGEFWVIVDNMMNLELLFRAHLVSSNKTYYDMAVSHANKTIENHLRKDFSSWHVVSFNETNGDVVRKFTAQGYSDDSCWSRGQAWLIYGFTTTFGYTKMNHFLEAAKHVADYYLDNLPDDGIAFWDFDVPKAKYNYIPRDSSSAAVAASGLFQLYSHSNNTKYLSAAHKIMDSLSSDKYRADGKPEYKIPALIVNTTITGPNAAPGKYDLALSYADYYFIKAFQYLD